MFVKNSNNALAWEKTRSMDERWKMGKIQLYQGIDTPKSVSGKHIKRDIYILFQWFNKQNKTLTEVPRHWGYKDELDSFLHLKSLYSGAK